MFVPILIKAFSRYVPLTVRKKSTRFKLSNKKQFYFWIIEFCIAVESVFI